MENGLTREDLHQLVDFLAGLGSGVAAISFGLIVALIFISPEAAVAFAVVDWLGSVFAYRFIRRRLRFTRLMS